MATQSCTPDLTMPRLLVNARPRSRAVWIMSDNKFVQKWVGTLRGIAITAPNGAFHFDTSAAAVAAAREFRSRCQTVIDENTP